MLVAFASNYRDIQTVWLTDRDGKSNVLYCRHEMLDRTHGEAIASGDDGTTSQQVTWHESRYNNFGEVILTASVPVMHPWHSSASGELTFALRPMNLAGIIAGMDVGANGQVFVVDRDGRLMAHGDRAVPLVSHDVAGHPALARMRSVEEDSAGPVLFFQGTVSIAYQKIPGIQWGVVVQKDVSEIYQVRNRFALLLGIFFLTVAILTVPLALWFSLRLTRPIKSLLTATRQLAEGDLASRCDISVSGEIGLLAKAFNRMAYLRQKSEQRYREIVDGTDNLITRADGEGKILFVNHVGPEVFGIESGQLEGMSAFQFVHPDDQERTREWFAQCIGERLAKAVFENRQVSLRDGRVSHFLWTCHFLYEQSGKCFGIDSIALNLTARKQAEEEIKDMEDCLRQSQKMEAMGTLAGGIAHDFNNILTPILGYAELVRHSAVAGSQTSQFISEVITAGNRAKWLVRQILAFSRRAEGDRAPLQLQSILKEVVQLIRATIPTTIEIHQDVDPECGVVLADPTQIHQVIVNLCTNAFQAMEETGGGLSISLKSHAVGTNERLSSSLHLLPGHYVKLEVRDTGIGMDAATCNRIFEPYFTTKPKDKGTGLGLAVVHGIIRKHGGEICVASEPGKGAIFTVYLPQVVATEEALPADAVTPLPTGKEHILLVDDEEIIVGMVKELLEGLGYHTTATTDSRQALALFQEHPDLFDLVITDMTMPHMTGAELSSKLLVLREDIPIILCTGYSERLNQDQAMTLGIRQYVQKPMGMDKIARIVRKVLDGAT